MNGAGSVPPNLSKPLMEGALRHFISKRERNVGCGDGSDKAAQP